MKKLSVWTNSISMFIHVIIKTENVQIIYYNINLIELHLIIIIS